jgi:type I restriction enzyme S subunit
MGKTGSIPALNLEPLLNFKIIVPKIEIQKDIVRTLDSLDTLINDISVGLPAEIKARRQQYEYYRNKLLTFKELDVA